MSTLAAYQKISTSLLTQKYKIWSNLVLFGLIQSILSTLILFSPLWSFAVKFGPLRSTSVLCDQQWSYSVSFSSHRCYSIYSISVHFDSIWSYSIHFGPIRSTLVLYSLLWSYLVYSVLVCPLRSIQSISSNSVHLCPLTYMISFWPKKIWPSNLDNLVDNLEAVWFRCFSHPLLPFGGSHA